MKKIIKWKNVLLIIIFVISCLVLLHDYVILATSLVQFIFIVILSNLLLLMLAN